MNSLLFKDIKNRAWSWYRGNMLEWVIKNLRDFNFAPKWFQDFSKNHIEQMVKGGDFLLSDKDFIKKHNDLIDRILLESQNINFNVNYTKELLEFQEAERDGNEYEMVDAICDMIVISINSGHTLGWEFGDYETSDGTQFNLTYPLLDRDCVYRICLELRDRGYDPYKCLVETIKELNTRTGAWNEQEGKWCKDLGAYSSEEALKEAEKYLSDNCIFPHDLSIVKEDCDFWLIAESEEYDEDEFEYLSIEQVSKEMMGYSCKVKKWYKADYFGCKLV